MGKRTATKTRQKKNKKYMLVRYGRMNELGWFEHNEAQVPKTPKRVVIKTDKGLELGYIVGQLSPYRKGQFRFSQDQLDEYYKVSEVDFECECSGKFIRYASSADVSEEKHLRKISREEIDCCRKFAEELELPMKIVDVEHIFGGERIVFYFMADGRIDFRELVKRLAQEYQTRIELRQIGSRDEAKLLGDYETCGQQCCCQRFLKTLKPINMRMAKMQKATLDPSKISGYCGRLKCCLRYEDIAYQELKRKLPKKNSRVKSEHGEGKVVDVQILTQLVMVEKDSGERFSVPVEEIEIIESVKIKEPAEKGNEEETVNQKENGSDEQ
ncbi:MAG: PSP1 domain-containing protein [Planctomycetota bacterium]|jgi:cell fate regulator YaaT (PSP1 superfamily)